MNLKDASAASRYISQAKNLWSLSTQCAGLEPYARGYLFNVHIYILCYKTSC